MDRKKILTISGSIRKNSVNDAILKGIQSAYRHVLDVRVFDQLHELPHFHPDIGDEAIDDTVKKFRRQIEEAQGVIICTPEYVFCLPGMLKNSLEWTVSTTVFSDKPVAFIIAAASGEKTFESLKLIMTTLGARIADRSMLLIQGARAKINPYRDDGDDEKTREEIGEVVRSLIQTINNEKGMTDDSTDTINPSPA